MRNSAVGQRLQGFILGTSIFISLSLSLALWIYLPGRVILDFAVNLFELACGLFSGMLLIFYAKAFSKKYIIIGTALAVFSWTLGQLYWFSYTLITGDILPYPSVGDMGYTGTYFLLIGIIGLILANNASITVGYWRYAVFIVMVVPIYLLYTSMIKTEALVFNFVLSAVISVALFRMCLLLQYKEYHWFAAGVLLLGIADIAFMISASLFPSEYTIIADALYPIAITSLTYGMMKGGLSSND